MTKEEYAEKYIKLPYYVVLKYYRNSYDKDELLSLGYEALWQAIKNCDIENYSDYQIKKYLIICVKKRILNYLTRQCHRQKVVKERLRRDYKNLVYIDSEYEKTDNLDLIETIKSEHERIDQDKVKYKIINLLLKGYGPTEMAKTLKISRSHVYHHIDNFKAVLKERFEGNKNL